MAFKERVFSGVQPTGNLHLGNYLGAIRRWTRLQHEAECLIFLADLHAITVYNDPAELRANVNGMAAALIACDIDPEKAVLFNHARVPAHPEMAWLLGCTARIRSGLCIATLVTPVPVASTPPQEGQPQRLHGREYRIILGTPASESEAERLGGCAA